MFLGTNILGFLVRGFFTNPEIDKLTTEGHEFIKKEAIKAQGAEKFTNIVAWIVIVAYLSFLASYNWGILIAALMIMAGSFSDLLWEIKHGKKVDPKALPKDIIYYGTTLLTWVALPVIWYSLYRF